MTQIMRNQILARAFIILFPYSKLCTCTQCQVLSTKNGSMEQQKQCNIDDVELIRTNWCSNEQRKEKICFHSPSTIPISALHGPNMRPFKLLSSSITGKKEYQKHLSKHEQSQTNQQVASLSNKKKYFLSSHLQASSSSSRARIS